jgi:hypothetical protein
VGERDEEGKRDGERDRKIKREGEAVRERHQ